MTIISPEQYQKDVSDLIEQLGTQQFSSVYGVPRGGVPLAVAISEALGVPLTDIPQATTLVVDDLIDSGKTLSNYPNNLTAVLYRKPHSPKTNYSVRQIDDWISFFYEDTKADEENIITRLLEVIGENPTREGLVETPKRVIKFYKEFLTPTEFNFTVFDSESYDEMIIQRDIPFFSLCEHHMAPFFGHATVAYIPKGKIVGLSKLARCVEHYSRRLQNQERITSQIAGRLQKELDPRGVGVTLSARHFCMEMRGVRTHDVSTTTTKVTGVFKTKHATRNEFLKI